MQDNSPCCGVGHGNGSQLGTTRQALSHHAPLYTWKTQTFIVALRCHSLTAPWIVDTPMNKQIFEIYIETQLAPTPSSGDVVIMDNVAFHKSQKVEKMIKKRGAWAPFLPSYSPYLN